jgi:hypothetical protein
MTRYLFMTILLAAALLGSPRRTPLAAQSVPSHYAFIDTRQEGGVFMAHLSPGTGVFDFGPGPGVAVGGWYGIRLGGPVGLEAHGTYFPTQRSLIDPGREEGDRKIGEADSRIVAFDVRLRFSLTGDRTWRKLAPFLSTGVGLAFDVAPEDPQEEILLADDRFDFGTPFLGVLGGGVRWLPTARTQVRADAGVTLWQLRAPRGYLDETRGLVGVDKREWVSGPSFRLGFSYRF